MTAADSTEAYPTSLEETKTCEGRGCVAGAARMIAAARARNHMQRPRKETLVETDAAQSQARQQRWARFAHVAGPALDARIRTAAAA